MRADHEGLDRILDSTDTRVTMTQRRASAPPGQVRIIGGQWRRTPLPVPDRLGLRPTPDRVRVTVFNWIEHLREHRWDRCRVLDAFAGTGCLGLEAASRGASEVTLIERDAIAASSLRQTLSRLRAETVRLHNGDAQTWLIHHSGPYDLVFLDPPFHQGLASPVLGLLSTRLAPGALVYLESELDLGLPSGWEVVREMRAGAVLSRLIQQSDTTPSV